MTLIYYTDALDYSCIRSSSILNLRDILIKLLTLEDKHHHQMDSSQTSIEVPLLIFISNLLFLGCSAHITHNTNQYNPRSRLYHFPDHWWQSYHTSVPVVRESTSHVVIYLKPNMRCNRRCHSG